METVYKLIFFISHFKFIAMLLLSDDVYCIDNNINANNICTYIYIYFKGFRKHIVFDISVSN